ncbi:carbohydrate-binding protein [Limibacter armeniacum]|uniref:carbohydrate-binding protein n=1 Tax=Limibacter armeniacum TaxID=466084 RepID=UPI002FE657D7
MKTVTNLKILFVMWVCLAIGHTASSQNWQLVWQDEFNGSISSDWVFETGTGSGGWGNNELQYYRQQNATVENGNLVITARRESFGGMNYTSARMKTQGRRSWKYGRIEARIQMPSFTGSWPAFWMLGDNISSVGWPSCGEIDIMEHVNTEGQTHGTIHWQDHNNSYASYSGSTGVNVTGYHIYAIEWDANAIRWYVDNTLFHEASIAGGVNGTHEFHNNFFVLLNMAVGGNWPGFTVDNNAFPTRMLVDYVRVYQASSSPSFSTQVEAENYAVMNGIQTESCVEGGLNVGWIDAGDWIVWDVNLPYSGTYNVEYRVASQNNGGVIQFEQAGGNPIFGSIGVPNTGGWQNWTSISHNVNMNAGQQQVAIYVPAGGYNLNWLKITNASGARLSSSLANELSVDAILLFPNPSESQLKVEGLKTESAYSIFDLSGKQVLKGILKPKGAVDIQQLKAGAYIMELGTGSKLKFIKK